MAVTAATDLHQDRGQDQTSISLPNYRLDAYRPERLAGQLSDVLGGSNVKLLNSKPENGSVLMEDQNGPFVQGYLLNKRSVLLKTHFGEGGDISKFEMGGVQLSPEVAREFAPKITEALKGTDTIHFMRSGNSVGLATHSVSAGGEDGREFTHRVKLLASVDAASGESNLTAPQETKKGVHALEGPKRIQVGDYDLLVRPGSRDLRAFTPNKTAVTRFEISTAEPANG